MGLNMAKTSRSYRLVFWQHTKPICKQLSYCLSSTLRVTFITRKVTHIWSGIIWSRNASLLSFSRLLALSNQLSTGGTIPNLISSGDQHLPKVGQRPMVMLSAVRSVMYVLDGAATSYIGDTAFEAHAFGRAFGSVELFKIYVLRKARPV